MGKNRLEAFSDGVLAIVITIMILELKQPIGDQWGDFAALWKTLATYLQSFFFIAIYWVNHHWLFNDAKQVNVRILWSNIAWLFVMSFIPFTTAWVGTYPSSRAPLCLYFGDMALTCITFHLLYYFIFKDNHPGQKFRPGIRSIVSLIFYCVAAVLGGFCPIAAFIIAAAVSLWWVIPEKKNKYKE